MSTMFVRVSSSEGQTQITVEQLARAMANRRHFITDDTDDEYEYIANFLHSARAAGFISETYKDDFYSVADTMSKYVRVNVAKSPYYPSDPDERKARRAELKQRVDDSYAIAEAYARQSN